MEQGFYEMKEVTFMSHETVALDKNSRPYILRAMGIKTVFSSLFGMGSFFLA